MLLYVGCLFKNMSYKWTKMKKLVMYIYLAYFNIMKGVNMKKNNFKNSVLAAVLAMAVVLSLFANAAVNVSAYYTDLREYEVQNLINVAGHEVQVNTAAEAARFNEEFANKIEKVKKQVYTEKGSANSNL